MTIEVTHLITMSPAVAEAIGRLCEAIGGRVARLTARVEVLEKQHAERPAAMTGAEDAGRTEPAEGTPRADGRPSDGGASVAAGGDVEPAAVSTLPAPEEAPVVPQRVEAPRQPATGGWRNWLSDERADVLRRGYPAGVQMHELRAQMEPLPGGPLPDSTTVALAANALKLRRPDGFKSSVMMERQPQPPVALAHADDLVTRDPPLVRPLAESLFWLTDARRAALVEGWPAGIETSELMRTMETLPGPPLPSYTRVVNAASGYLKLRRPVGFLAARGRQGAGEPSAEKNPAAVALGHKGGLVGGVARAANMTPDERSAAAKLAAEARWAKTADVPQPDVPATPVTAGPPPTEAALAPAARESAETGATTAPASVVLLPRAGSPSPRAEDTPKVRIADFVQIEQWAAQRGIMFNGDNLDEVNRVARRVGAPQFELRINRRALAR